MPIGINSGGQLNVIVFEVGLIITDPTTGQEETITVAVHPLFVAPESIQYTDRSRSSLVQTTGGSLYTVSGRALQDVALDGTFGVESRGAGPIVGSGELRFQRFRREVVRLGDALFRDDIAAALESLTGSVASGRALSRFNPGTTLPFINYYDFWHRISFSCQIPQFGFGKTARGGGATGLTRYRMAVREVGPVVGSLVNDVVLEPLFNAFTVWDGINDVLESYTVAGLTDAALALPGLAVTQLADTLSAVTGSVADAQRVMGSSPGRSTSAAAYLAQAARLRREAETLSGQLGGLRAGSLDAPGGALDWGDAGNREVALYDEAEKLNDVEDAAAWQQAAGALWGMSRAEYQRWMRGGGSDGLRGTDIAGSVSHKVGELDSEATIARQYGVPWDAVLAANDKLPDEALVVGTDLAIPVLRPLGPSPITGLPTFGSHVGRAAWGADVAPDLRVEGGKPVVVDEEDVLLQGSDALTRAFGSTILVESQAIVAPAQTAYVEERLRAMYLSDRRILQVQSVDVRQAATGLDIDMAITTINGETVRTGAP